MNDGLPRSDNRVATSTPVTLESALLEGMLRSAARDTKVIFGALRGVFDLNRAAVENFFHLIDQRVYEQNGCRAAICEVCIYYTDGTSRKFPSIDAFKNYSETRKRYPTVVTVHLSYFIQFPNTDAPEKQEIDITIRASDSMSEVIDMVETDSQLRMSGDKIQVMASNGNTQFGVISYNISHSRISWGLDLEGHIKSNIEKILEHPSTADRFLRRIAGPLNLFTTVFVGLYAVNQIIDRFFSFLYESDGANTKEKVLDVAAQYLVNGQIAKYIVASLVVAVVFFVLFSALISRLTKSLSKPKPSFIVLDDGDERHRAARLKSYEKRWTNFAVAIGLDAIVAVLLLVAEDRFGYLIGLGS